MFWGREIGQGSKKYGTKDKRKIKIEYSISHVDNSLRQRII